MLFGDISVHHINDYLDDKSIAQVIDKVNLHEKAEFNALFPQQRWAEVIITMTDGQVIKSVPTRTQGDFDTPYSNEILQQKAAKLLALVMPDKQIIKVLRLLSPS